MTKCPAEQTAARVLEFIACLLFTAHPRIQHGNRCRSLYARDGPRYDTWVVSPMDDERFIFHPRKADGGLCPGNGRRRFECGTEHNRHAVEMPPKIPPQLFVSVTMCPFCTRNGSLFSLPRSRAAQKPAPNSTPLTAGMANTYAAIRFSKPTKHRLAKACRKPVYHTFNHAADGISVRLRLRDFLLHGCSCAVRNGWKPAFPRPARQTVRCR